MCHNQWRRQLWGTGVRAPQASNRTFFRKNKITPFKQIFSWAFHPMAINCPYYLCPKSIKIRLRASASSKSFPRLYPNPSFKAEGKEGKREGGIRWNGRKGMGRKDR
jgi:hypothetical protein